MVEGEGRKWVTDLRDRGLVLGPSKKQQDMVERLLAAIGQTIEQATEAAALILSAPPTRAKFSTLIDHLKEVTPSDHPASPKQLKLTASLAKKRELDEPDACALVECKSYEELRGGRGGTASRLTDALVHNSRSRCQNCRALATRGSRYLMSHFKRT